MASHSADLDLGSRPRWRDAMLPSRRVGRRGSAGPPPGEGTPDRGSSALARVNHLLVALEPALGELPHSLDRTAAFAALQRHIGAEFSPTALCLLEVDDRSGTWTTKLAVGCTLPEAQAAPDLPGPLADVVARIEPQLVSDLAHVGSGVAPGSGSGIYLPLCVGRNLVGAIGIEHTVVGEFGPDDLDLAIERSSGWALLVDDVRRFGRIRALSADASEARVARELHDRLGQWLTYVSLEVEGIIRHQPGSTPELARLHTTVQSAIEEMRDTLRQLLAGVSADRPLALVAREICERFEERTEVEVTYESTPPAKRLAVPVEVEFSRILQLALGNCERHASASRIRVRWDTDGARATLSISDDGVGFDPSGVVRDAAGGLIDMRERANTIGADLLVSSQPGAGTTVSVTTAPASKEWTS